MKEDCQFFLQENGRAAWSFYKIGRNEVLPGLREWRYIIPFLSIWILNDFNERIKKDYWDAVCRLLCIFLQTGWLTTDTEIRKAKGDNRMTHYSTASPAFCTTPLFSFHISLSKNALRKNGGLMMKTKSLRSHEVS